VAKAGLGGLAHALEIDAVDGIDLGFRRFGGHAGDGVMAGFGSAALFQRGLLFGGVLERLFGIQTHLLGIGGDLLVGPIQRALIAHALGIERLGSCDILGLLDLAEEVVDGEVSFAGAGGFIGHRRKHRALALSRCRKPGLPPVRRAQEEAINMGNDAHRCNVPHRLSRLHHGRNRGC